MNPEIGSLDDVVRDDRLCTALGERRFDDPVISADLDDELTSTMAFWCQDLDFGLENTAGDLSTPDLAKAAARRRALQRSGRLVGAAAAVAAVCVGGLAVTHLTASTADNQDNAAQPIKSGPVSTPSLQSREKIWQDLSSARDALVKQNWSSARSLLAAASGELSGVSADDGHDALQTWISTLTGMLNNHTTIEPTASLASVANTHSGYVVDNHGVPMLPDMSQSADTAQQDHPQQLPPLPPLTTPTSSATNGNQNVQNQAVNNQTRSGQQGGGASAPATSAGAGQTTSPSSGGTSAPTKPGSGSTTTPPASTTPPSTAPSTQDPPPLPPAPQIQINAPLLRQLLPEPSTTTSTSTSTSTSAGTGTSSSPTSSASTSNAATNTNTSTSTSPSPSPTPKN